MNRIWGVLSLLVTLYVILFAVNFEFAATWINIKNVLSQQAFFGILTLGVGVLIISGGIDLSIGSVVGFSGVTFGVLIERGINPFLALAVVVGAGVVIGLVNGLLVTKMRLQPFLVTLCGLFFYRGLARLVSQSQQVGVGVAARTHPEIADPLDLLGNLLVGKGVDAVFGFPMQVVVMLALAFVIGVLLHRTTYGRAWYAIGHNEQAAKYAGINVDRHKIAAYVLCSTLAAFGGVLALLETQSASANTFGDAWELYAITGAVLGGCSLRGGVGTVPGMILGAAVLPQLKNLLSFVGGQQWVRDVINNIDPFIPVFIGLTLLFGTIADEFFRRRGKG